MKIQSISIVPEDVGCDAACKYCIVSMTPELKKTDKRPIIDKYLSNALLYARAGGAQTAILTSKGETLASDFDYLAHLLEMTHQHGFGQKDLHSNMLRVANSEKKRTEFLEKLVQPDYGLTNITMTVASLNPEKNTSLMGKTTDYAELLSFLKENHLVVRFSCVLNKEGVYDQRTIEEYCQQAADIGVDQIVFRGLWIPDNARTENKIYHWCKENVVKVDVANKAIENFVKEGKAIHMYDLPWGQSTYEIINGPQVTGANCMINSFSNDTLKSVVYLPDNHLYSNWTAKKPIL